MKESTISRNVINTRRRVPWEDSIFAILIFLIPQANDYQRQAERLEAA